MDYRKNIGKNLAWFRNSGVMKPADGSWGVAERIALMERNEAADAILRSFPAWTDVPGGVVIEQRRADCCFEAALLHLLAGELYGDAECAAIGGRILEFLYCRSGLLNRFNKGFPAACWNWAHTCWWPALWFDDNGWAAACQIVIGSRWPETERRYSCIRWGSELARTLLDAVNRCLDFLGDGPPLTVRVEPHYDPEKIWSGAVDLPHWSMPVTAAFLAADAVGGDPGFQKTAARIFRNAETYFELFSASELAYLAIIAPLAEKAWEDPVFGRVRRMTRSKLAALFASSPDGIPSSEHFEAPPGKRLADLIYTVNWALAGWISLADGATSGGDAEFRDRLAGFLCRIQDDSDTPLLKGCWRGMYDLERGCWGGGNRFEGGADSIYTGWTNAPIALSLLLISAGMTWENLLKR